MISGDGGHVWKTSINASLLTLPVAADDTGPTNRITLTDEFGPDTFLAAVYARDDSVHFMYDVYEITRQHYVRADTISGTITKNIWPTWRAGASELHAFDGFFVSRQDGWLFAAGAGDDARLVIFASDDDGETWLDYARSDPMPTGYAIYSVSGSRSITPDGYILGAFTEQQYPNVTNSHFVELFRVDTSKTPP